MLAPDISASGAEVLQVDMAVAIAVDAVVDDVFGQHLDHADLAGPGALGVHRVEIAVFEQFERGEDLRAEDMRAAAVMGERDQRVERVVVALEGAVIGLERPEGQQDAAADAEAALRSRRRPRRYGRRCGGRCRSGSG
jgi:hypothetical protein